MKEKTIFCIIPHLRKKANQKTDFLRNIHRTHIHTRCGKAMRGINFANTFRKKGFAVKIATQELKEKRRITPTEIEKWFTPDTSAYGAKMCSAVGSADLQKIVNLLIAACDKTVFDWKSEISFFIIEKAES